MSDSLATTWTASHQASRSMEFSRQEFWSGLLFPSAGNHSDPGIEPVPPVSPTLVGKFFITAPSGKPPRFLLLERDAHTHTHTHTHTPYSELSQKDGKDEESCSMF
ncbi:unnamed protein product [Rangifer tarandus platyrhynchus]|uniref:Uncharacterized protein n=1 Tax=Rangifer tarandus platyrhynchus TaxID=3082113 RepID=A0ABN8YFK5_RANTA|nr:unnamed protein product [Rangifer tarandus platyrhynchus]